MLQIYNKYGQLKVVSSTSSTGVSSVSGVAPITSTGGSNPIVSTSIHTNKLIGRGSASTGVMEEITIGAGLALTGTVLNVISPVIPHALTKTNDTNVTITLGGTPSTSLLQDVSLTLGWTGTLADSRISSASIWNGKQDVISLTTLGTSGAATFISNVLNIPQYTDIYTGTVTSVAALTLGTVGTDLSSSVANSTTTPVITLNVPTASATNRGALSSTDWTTFNNKQNAIVYTPANEDGTILYHSVKWFTPTSTVSSSGTTVTSIGTQFTSIMVGAKLTISGESRIITAFINSTNVTVASAYSQNYSGIAAGSWGVYSKAYSIAPADNPNYFGGYIISDYRNTMLLRANYDRTEFGLRIADTLNNVAFNPTNNNAFQLGGNKTFQFFPTAASNALNGTADLGIRRNSAGILEIYDGITATGLEANRRDLLVRNIFGSKLLIGTTVDNGSLSNIQGSVTAASLIARGQYLAPTLTASANNDVLVGLDIASSFTLGGFTNVGQYHLRIASPPTNGYSIFLGGNASINGSNQMNLYRNGATVFGSSSVETNVSTSSPNVPLKFTLSSGALEFGRFFATTGNFIVQNGGTFTDISSARLQVNSTTQGFLPPRMTNAQRIAIVSPAIGLMVYCTDTVEGVYVNKSIGWTFIG
jgi:hypothetical protein